MRGECSQQEECLCWILGNSQGNAFKEVMDAESEDNEETSGRGLDALLNRNLNLIMTVSMVTLHKIKVMLMT